MNSRGRLTAAAVVCALTAADAVLVGFAYRHLETAPAGAHTAQVQSSGHQVDATPTSAQAQETQDPGPADISKELAGGATDGSPQAGIAQPGLATPEASRTAVAPPQSGPAQLHTAAWNDQVAWKAVSSPCGQDPVVWRTEDGGDTWTQVTVPELGQVTRLRATGPQAAFLVGGGRDCVAGLSLTDDAGATWQEQPQSLGGTWYVDPAKIDTVVAPDQTRTAPCGDRLVDMAALGTLSALAMCDDGTVALTSDGAVTWDTFPAAGDVMAIGTAGDSYVLAATSFTCEGIDVTTLAPDGTLGASGCAPFVPGGAVSVTGSTSATWLMDARQTLRSIDGGVTWQ